MKIMSFAIPEDKIKSLTIKAGNKRGNNVVLHVFKAVMPERITVSRFKKKQINNIKMIIFLIFFFF